MKITVGFTLLVVLPMIALGQWKPTLQNPFPPPGTDTNKHPAALISPWVETEIDVENHMLVHPSAIQILPPGEQPREKKGTVEAMLTEDRVVGEDEYDITFAGVDPLQTNVINEIAFVPDNTVHALNANQNGFQWVQQPHQMGNILAGVPVPKRRF